MDSMQESWKLVERFISEDLSLIPVWDKNTEDHKAKEPIGQWKAQQNNKFTLAEIWTLLENNNTNAIGIICGAISGNLEVIDIDSKHKAGIDALLFNDIKTLYPHLLERLRIHRTPSGGFHILYRCDEPVSGNLKLAGRYADEEELLQRPKQKIYHYLETRGEGGYIAAPPAFGYKIVKDNPLPVITKQERESLLQLCRNYNEIIKQDKPLLLGKAQESIYEESPFDDFNARCNPNELMEQAGWQVQKANNNFIWYTRPGGTKGNIHASFNIEKRFFYIFTASTVLEPAKGYSPANLAAALLYDNDKKKLYKHLVDNGYGKLKDAVEKRLVKTAAIKNKEVQGNFSEQAKQELEDIKKQSQLLHPYGIFWEIDDEDKITISRERLYIVAENLGFRLHNSDIVQIIDKFIYSRDARFFYDAIKAYIKEEDADLYEDICNTYEQFIQHSGKFTIERLPLLDEASYVKDTRATCNKFYKNGFLTITSENITFNTYDILTKLVFYSRIQQRDYNAGNGGKYVDFLEKACELGKREKHIQSIIGFLAHEFKDETTGYIIILTEQVQDPKNGGGSGKNVFCNLLKQTTTYISKAGTQTKYDEKFFQLWNGEKIFAISDAPENFDFLFLKEPATGDIVLKKLFKDECVVNVADAPKFIVQTNYSYEVADGGLKRRMHAIEFTDFFTNCGGVDVHYGCHFPAGWNATDWAGYDNFIAISIQHWINSNLKIAPSHLTETGWQKQFSHTYGTNTATFIRFMWDTLARVGYVSNEQFKRDLEAFYIENNINRMFQPSMQKINAALKEWCDHFGYHFEKDVQHKNEFGQNEKGRTFEENSPF